MRNLIVVLVAGVTLVACDSDARREPSTFDLTVGFEPTGVLAKGLGAELHDRLGAARDGRWHVNHGQWSCDALVATSHAREIVSLPPTAAAQLTFVALVLDEGPLTVELALDGSRLDRFEVSPGAPLMRALDVPPSQRPRELTLRVDGPGELVALAQPCLRVVAATPDARPDVVILLADTFRADNLATYGGDPRLAPALDAFAASSRTFLDARAAATWTLASHAALFTGRTAYELGVTDARARLPDDAPTLARTLRDAGYRTVAITDGGLTAARHGLDLGFGWYEEAALSAHPDLARTRMLVERALDADDGRPTFLFVQSYRAHEWVVDEATRVRLAPDDLAPNATFHDPAWRRGLLESLAQAEHGVAMAGLDYDTYVAPMVPNYRGASADAAQGFGELLDTLRQRSLLSSAVVVFTSDHGESLGEHGVVSHGNGVWDDQARVPLVVRAPGLALGLDRRPVLLTDLPRTLATLASVAPDPRWGGRDLTVLDDAPRALLVHQTLPAKVRYLAVVHGRVKWIFEEESGMPGRLAFTYDLARDPEERHDLTAMLGGSLVDASARETLARETLAREVAVRGARRAVGSSRATLDGAARERLRALGYATDER